ncbi:MAG: hypothetical protein U9N35_08265 [Euryarchaeota archaeon]|nr:hypothetical protein [Euryarchaeota archaeon]
MTEVRNKKFKKLTFFLLLFLFFFYTTSLFKNCNINNTFQRNAEITLQEYKTYEKTHKPKKPWEIPPEDIFHSFRMDNEYIWRHFIDHYARTCHPNVFSWIPFRSPKLRCKEIWYHNQISSILNVWFIAPWEETYREQLSDYRTEFRNTVDVASYNDTKKLWEDYASGLMKELPPYEEVKKDFDDIPEKLSGSMNEKRLKEFYKREMEMLEENYKSERPERILYDIDVLKTLERLAENKGAISYGGGLTTHEEFFDISYTNYLVEGIEIGLIALLQTLFVSVGYWKLIERKKTKKSEE